MCHSACEFTRADDEGLATAKCVMDPARLVMHERKSAHRSESLVRGLSRRRREPRKSTRELLSEQRRERAAVARSEETSVRLQLVFDGIAASGRRLAPGEALQLEEDDVHLVSDGFHLRDVVDAAKKGDLRTRRGWIARVLRARTAAQHAIRNAVGTDHEIHGVDLQNCIMMSDVMASFGIKGIGATLHEVEVLWEACSTTWG
ncbi:sulfate adenylyltransferase [Aureococcus anophagefferens]|nr:sulfate adenylyltransferase [Aureococcus anophagefferens]